MRVFSVIGYSGSGKTTTIEKIIPELRRRGYSVASVKEIHSPGFTLDTAGSNTHRHRMSGAQVVVARGPGETGIMFGEKLAIKDILAFFNHDFAVLEGVTDFDCPRIFCARSREELQGRNDPLVFAISGVIANTMSGEYAGIPIFNSLAETGRLVDLLERIALVL